ncbi:MAG: hypothetical protein HYY46_02635, partial [Deltaproteobacteria bacterium]|nr:hypothetical protein [Deltaproteobacteria bacterium]
TNASGRPDTVYYYEDDKLAREERDEKGEGHVTYRAFYQNGRLYRVEKSAQGNGKMDLWVTYDTSKEGEIVLREERDLNSDGAVDLWSYFENGRLVRRDVSAVGLEYITQRGKNPQMESPNASSPAPPAR